MGLYLSFKEIWRNRNRFLLFSLVIALITLLVLFIAGLAQGLSNANIEYLSNLDAQLIAFQEKSELSASASQISRATLNNIQRVEGVSDIGSIGAITGKLVTSSEEEPEGISIVGVEPGKPGSPSVFEGQPITLSRGNQAVLDEDLAKAYNIQPGDVITIRTIRGDDEVDNQVRVIGITKSQEYLYQSTVFLPSLTWNELRPQAGSRATGSDVTTNIVAIKVDPALDSKVVAEKIMAEVDNLEVVDLKTAYEATPGYSAQQSTLNTQQGFTLLIGVLVIGGFFQIQMLQKVPLIGVLKAIGTPNRTVAVAVVSQIILVSTFGVFFGGLVTFLLALALPASVPIVFSGPSVILAIVALLVIGPLGGLVSVRLAVGVEPLTALGLSS